MSVVALSGGVGGSKLALGLYHILPPNHLTVAVNVSDDFSHLGLHVSPDIDKWAKNLAKIPVYAFAGGNDRVVPAERSQRMISAIQKAGGKKAKIKIYPNEGHAAGRNVFGGQELYEWMFAQKRP